MIENPSDSPNTDGIDPESCEDVLILGTHISVGDDCVAIKSGKLYMAEKHFRRTERVTVRNCLFEKGHGGVTVGITGYSGGKVKEMSKYNVHVPIDDMQITEDLHMVLDHCMMKILCQYE